MKIKVICFIGLIIVLILGYLAPKSFPKPQTNQAIQTNTVISTPSVNPPPISPPASEPSLPANFQIANVPFAPQAPFGLWDHAHDEACEEAALTIVYYYISGQTLTPDLMEKEIQKEISWEEANLGSGDKNLTVAELRQISESVYALHPTIKTIQNVDDIKAEISQNHLVIIPAAGRELNNPNFRSPGPIYHMLVISGYTDSQFITQDIGTRRGQNYRYLQHVLYNAIHDWESDNIDLGAKNILVF